MNKKLKIELFKQFDDGYVLSKEELVHFLEAFYEKLTESSTYWRIFELKNNGVITKITNNKYRVNKYNLKPVYEYNIINLQLLNLLLEYNSNYINSRYMNDEEKLISIWDVQSINEFTRHVYTKNVIYIDIHKTRIDNLKEYLRINLGFDYLIVNDDKDVNIYNGKNYILVRHLIKRAPLKGKKTRKTDTYILTPKLEKIIVDVFTNKNLFRSFDKNTISEVLINANEKYNIDFTTLLYYARNRGVKDDMIRLIESELKVIVT